MSADQYFAIRNQREELENALRGLGAKFTAIGRQLESAPELVKFDTVPPPTNAEMRRNAKEFVRADFAKVDELIAKIDELRKLLLEERQLYDALPDFVRRSVSGAPRY
jgi:hypothetical protein